MSTGNTFEELIEGSKKPLTIEQFRSLASKYAVIDTRLEGQKTGIIKGSYWFPGQALLCSWLTSFLSPQEPYLFVCDRSELEEVLERFVLMGYFNCMGYNNFDMKHYEGDLSFPILRNFNELGDTERKQFLDVRTPWEWGKTGVMKGAMLVELKKLDKGNQEKLNMLKQIRKKKLIVVNCRQGQRGKVAASILFRHGVNSVTLEQNFEDLPKLGLKIQSLQQNEEYWKNKGAQWSETSDEQQNQIEKQLQTDNMNRMAVEECYEECLHKHPEKSPQQCRQECSGKKVVKSPEETMKLQHSKNKNQLQARKQSIVPSKKQQNQFKNKPSSEKLESSDTKLYKKALQSFISHNYSNSISDLDKMISKNQKNPQLYINRALCQAGLGNMNDAYSDLLKSIQIDHRNFVAYFNLASLKLSQHQNERQEKLIALQNLRRSLSCLYVKKSLRTKDESDIEKSIKLYPHNVEALLMKAFKLSETGRLEESLNCLEKINEFKHQKNNKILELTEKVKARIQQARKTSPAKEDNPESQKNTELSSLKQTSSGITVHSSSSPQKNSSSNQQKPIEEIDEQIFQIIEQWNRLYKELFGQDSNKMKKLQDIQTPPIQQGQCGQWIEIHLAKSFFKVNLDKNR